MYLSHFGLREPPFSLTPDTDFFFARASHQEAFNTLLLALLSGEGFIKLTGEVGLGKTTVVRRLLNELGDDFVTAYIPNPYIDPREMQISLAEDLGFAVDPSMSLERISRGITEQLLELARAGRQTVLFLDEAQALPQHTLESVRLLTNLETEKTKLLQVVLVGQPELDSRLTERGVRQLRQRITFSHTLRPMDSPTLNRYIEHRLRVAGRHGEPLFTPGALRLVYHASGGVPRLANILCHKALMAAYGPGLSRVGRAQVLAAIADTEGVSLTPVRRLLELIHENDRLLLAAVLLSLGLAWSAGRWL